MTLFDLLFHVNKLHQIIDPATSIMIVAPISVDDNKESIKDRLRMLVSDRDVKDMLD